MRKLGFSKKHGGITTPLILYVILGFLLFSVPPALAASGADTIYDVKQVSSTFAVNEITSYPEEYQYNIDIPYDSTNYRESGQYTNNVHRPDVSVADSFRLPDFRIEELTIDDWQSPYYDPFPLGDIPHGAIDIDDDGDFAGQGWPGSGTEGAPYLIENLLIDKGGAAGHCISIRNTQVYFVIKNCTILGASTSNAAGISFVNVENGRIEGCDFNNNFHNFWIEDSSDCTLFDCYLAGAFRTAGIQYSTNIVIEQCTFIILSYGPFIYDCEYLEVRNCTFDGQWAGDTGMFVSSSNHSTIEDCEFMNFDEEGTVHEGLFFAAGLYNTISECNFTGNSMGLYFGAWHSIATRNYFRNNTYCGLTDRSSNSIISDNLFYQNGDYGILVYDTLDSNIHSNIVTETGGVGIGVVESFYYPGLDGALITNNTCVENEYGMAFLGHMDRHHDNTFTENNCSFNTFDGMYFENCDSNILEDNICTFNGRHGIVLYEHSYLNTLSNNNCSRNQVGILLEDRSHENTLVLNTCDFCDVYAICLIDSSQNELSYNDCNQSSFDGIAVLNLSEANDLLNNTCNDNVGFGVYVNGTGSNTIEDGEYSHNEFGIYLDWTFSNIISSCICEYNDIGIMIINDYDPASNELIDNDCSHNLDQGIVLIESGDNLLDNNYCTDNGAGIYIFHAQSNDLMNNTCVVNTLYGIYFIDSNYNWLSDNNCSDNPNGLWIEDSNAVTALETELIDCTTGITVIGSSGVYLSDNICTESDIGVSMTSSIDGRILNSNCSDNTLYGIYLNAAHNIEVENNEITYNNMAGIYIVNTNGGEVTSNIIDENFYGVYIESGTLNIVGDNYISDSLETGVHIDSAPVDSYIHCNILVDNFRNALDDGLTSLIIFNFWSNYTGVDADSDGYGDTPHNITGAANNADPYPLVFHPGAPVFNVDPTNQAIEFGDTFYYDIGATSDSPLKEWRIDDTVHFSISSSGVITNIIPLDLGLGGLSGEYPIEVAVENIYNYTTTATFTVICQDTVIPTVVGPVDFSYVEGTTGHTIRWNASDLTLDEYFIDVVGPYYVASAYYVGFFNSTNDYIEISIDGLGDGIYNITITVQDRAFNHGYDFVIVTVTKSGGTGYTITFEMFLLGAGVVGVAVIVVVIFVLKRRTP